MASGRLRYDIYPAQAPSNCCCALPGVATAYKLFSKLRPRRCRKTVYQSRLHEGSCDLSDARRLFGYCATSLPPSTRQELEAQLSRLEEERQTFDKFFEYYGSHKAQRDALSRAQAFCGRARDILRKVMVLHEGWSTLQTNQHKRQVHSSARSPVQGHYESPNTPHGIAARSYHQVLVPHADSPLQTMQIRASPVDVTETPRYDTANTPVLDPFGTFQPLVPSELAGSGYTAGKLLPSV
ncbi:hypothetical protein BD413DRAFT_269101 [Trametes elegans]|nr:hypothetical protein BD413DRAFT_269101 [Trametes elegans]